jgi:hypothetical protein
MTPTIRPKTTLVGTFYVFAHFLLRYLIKASATQACNGKFPIAKGCFRPKISHQRPLQGATGAAAAHPKVQVACGIQEEDDTGKCE